MFETVIQLIKDNLLTVGIALGILFAGYIANFVFGVCLSTLKKISWDWGKFGESLLKLVCFVLGFGFITVGISCLKPFIEVTGLVVSEDLTQFVTITMVVTVIIIAALKYYKDAIEKIMLIFNFSDEDRELAKKQAQESGDIKPIDSLPISARVNDADFEKLVQRNKTTQEQ